MDATAQASPEKRLFISLITRDISLIDAIIDLTDNSVNAAMKPLRNSFASSKDFVSFFSKRESKPPCLISVLFDKNKVEVIDNASGIPFDSARDEVFRFGHSESHSDSGDRLSVYGIGMKRALFKIGQRVSIVSDHEDGGFSLNLDVPSWAQDTTMPWTLPISSRKPRSSVCGTRIVIENLNADVQKRLEEPSFAQNLTDKLARVYSYFLGRVVRITVNGKNVDGTEFEVGQNFSHESFKSNGVDCTISAGITAPSGQKYLAEASGWFVFCNYRTVIYGDKSVLTGWGGALPQFQPKHRPFIGLVTFTSRDPEDLPWTTTKGSINEDNLAWQEAKAKMVSVARPILQFLDQRYSDQGTDIDVSKVAEAARQPVNVFTTTISQTRVFKAPVTVAPRSVKVQYPAKPAELEAIKKHLSRARMSATEIGRMTFDFFLRNEVGLK